jgi:hypothetical protein
MIIFVHTYFESEGAPLPPIVWRGRGEPIINNYDLKMSSDDDYVIVSLLT